MEPLADPWGRVFSRSETIVSRTILDEHLLVPVSGRLADLEKIFSLGGAGAFVWELLDGERSLGVIRAAMVERYDAPPEEIGGDLLAFVADLERAGLVRREA
jgi:hypothetical protein